jgi:hypothetical protein
MTDPEPTPRPTARLTTCHGGPPPDFVTAGWAAFLGLPQAAKEEFWEVLVQPLLDPSNAGNDALIQSFAEKTGAEVPAVVGALQAASFLLRRAAALNLAPPALRADLSVLSGGTTPEADILLSRYEAARDDLRQLALRDTLATHGKLFAGLEWRIDNVAGSSVAVGLDATVILLTLRYLDGDKLEKVTLQFPQPAIAELKAFCDRFGEQRTP